MTSAVQLFRIATGGLADLIHGDVTAADSHAMSRAVESIVSVSTKAGDVDRIAAEGLRPE